MSSLATAASTGPGTVTAGVNSPGNDPALGEDSADTAIPAYVWLFLAGMAFNMFSGNSYLLHLPLGPDRPLFLLSFVLLLLDPYRERWRWRPVYAVMLLTLVNTCIAWWRTGSPTDTYKAYMLSDRILMPFLMFAIGPMIFSTLRRRLLLLKSLAVLGIYWGFTGICEIAHLSFLVFPSFIMDPNLGIGFGRARGVFLASEPLGMACAMAFFTSGLLFTMVTGRWRIVAVLAMVFGFIGDALCMTRTEWLALILGALVIGFLVPSMRRRLPVVVLGTVGVVALALFAIPGLYAMLNDRLTTSRSIYDRLLTDAAAMKIISAHPFSGVGWGNFVDVNVDWVRQADTFPLTTVTIEVHNVFLSRAAETGVQGAVLWGLAVLLGPVAATLYRTPTREARGWQFMAIAALFVWIFPSVSSPNPYPFPNNLVWLVCGIASRPLLLLPARLRPPASTGPHHSPAPSDHAGVHADTALQETP